jgi:haloalkane dehalogenase
MVLSVPQDAARVHRGGGRVVAPDFFGFGRSDKSTEDATYTFDFHRDTLMRVSAALDLQRITLVCQD